MRNATLCFLVKEDDTGIKEVCLAMKKRGFGKDRWNGVGGKVGDKVEESIEEAAIREAKEEISVNIQNLEKVGELDFVFPHNSDWNQLVHVFLVREWEGDPKESEEMNPKWFNVRDIPYDSMWSDDIYWLPEVLKGNCVNGRFLFGEGDIMLEQEIKVVKDLFPNRIEKDLPFHS